MMRLRAIAIAAFALILAAAVGSARAVSVPLTGLLQTASTSGSSDETELVTFTPPSGSFVITQFCGTFSASETASTVRLSYASGPSLTFIADTAFDEAPFATPSCQLFNPGVPIPRNTPVVCTFLGETGSCSITYVTAPGS